MLEQLRELHEWLDGPELELIERDASALAPDRHDDASSGPAPAASAAAAGLPAAIEPHVAEWPDLPQGAEGSKQLFVLLYGELRRLAQRQMLREDMGHTLSATALAHEAYFKLAEQTRTHWRNRAHFLAIASTMMRRILVNHAKARLAAKRDAELVPLALLETQSLGNGDQAPCQIARVHDALLAFEQIDPRAAKVVELKFFGGMEIDEIAEALDVSAPTVKRDWAVAKAWLRRELAAS
jgi:RNA polymerase sigma factor (TIGR02999 family)